MIGIKVKVCINPKTGKAAAIIYNFSGKPSTKDGPNKNMAKPFPIIAKTN